MTKTCPLSRKQFCLVVSTLSILGVYFSAHMLPPGVSHLLLQPIHNTTLERSVHHATFLASRLLSGSHPTSSSNVSSITSDTDADGSRRDRTDTLLKNGTQLTLRTGAGKTRDGNSSASGIGAQNTQRTDRKVLPNTAEKARDGSSSASGKIQKNEGKVPANTVNESNSKIPNPKANIQSSAHHPERYLLHGYQGRLGNVLFQFAAAYCIAALNNLTLVVNNPRPLQDLRHLHFPSRTPATPVKNHPAAMGCAFHSTLMTLEPTNASHALGGYFQSWRYFEPCKAEVKRAIRFKDNIVNKAVGIIADLRKKLPGRTLVGVHVRMEDYLLPSEKRVGRKVAPPDYYHRALTYFRSKFRDVTFVVIASNPSWFRSKVSDSPDVFMLGRNVSPAVDMEALSRMDHLIFSVGTFGWWAGYKNNGTVVGYKDFYVPESVYGRKMSSSDDNYFYPGWIRL